MLTLEKVLALGPARRACLSAAGVQDPSDLLVRCATPVDRRRFHDVTGLGPAQLLDWALTLDLMRLPGVDAETARLLRAAGVDGVAPLRARQPVALVQRLRELAPERADLDEECVDGWVRTAGSLPTLVQL